MHFSKAGTTALCIASLWSLLYGQDAPKASVPPTEVKGIPARATAADYQAQAKTGAFTIAADFVGHSVPTPEATLSTEDFVVIETALFGPADTKLRLAVEDFTLFVNGKKKALASQPPGMVFKSLKDPEWAPPKTEDKKSKTSFGGGGNTDGNVPVVVHVPLELRRTMAQRVEKASLPQGERPLPQAGLIFFDYHGKTQTMHSIELVYKGPAGEATLTLTP